MRIKEYFNSQIIDDSVIEKGIFLQLMKITENKPIFSSILMVYLWNMLNAVANQKSVIDLLITYSKINMKSFIKIICNTFTNNNFDDDVSLRNNCNVFKFEYFSSKSFLVILTKYCNVAM